MTEGTAERLDARALAQTLDLVDYRRRVAELYDSVLDTGVGRESWEGWCAARTELLTTHPQGSLVDGDTIDPESPLYFDYDPSWHLVGTVEPLTDDEPIARVQGGSSILSQIGWVSFERHDESHRLGLFWLDAYGGGLFLPFRDTTNGTSTYGAGRYLLDGAKSADLGSPGPNQLLVDFNFSYHPSCMWDPQWPCPLAPAVSHLTTAVEAGERQPKLIRS